MVLQNHNSCHDSVTLLLNVCPNSISILQFIQDITNYITYITIILQQMGDGIFFINKNHACLTAINGNSGTAEQSETVPYT